VKSFVSKENTKLVDGVRKAFGGLSYGNIQKLLRKKDIKVNGKRVTENVDIFAGDKVEVFAPDQDFDGSTKIDIVYDDENVVVVNKPFNIEVAEADSVGSLETLVSQKLGQKVYAVHRLDRNTTGLVLLAKTSAAKEILLDAFKAHKIEKTYLAEVVGVPEQKKARLVAYHKKDAKKAICDISISPKKGYSEIITSYKVAQVLPETTILQVKIETGKTHQIRAHLAFIGLPIVGDDKYGNREYNHSHHASRQHLVASSLSFPKDFALASLSGKTITLPALPTWAQTK
jgi:23S rRNA pseudouridine955/2504/2580 synthase